jgi:hypothetical protein
MLSLPFQNLTIALCLALQVTATACVPCPCPCTEMQIDGGSREAPLLSANGTPGTSTTCCLLCESRTETQHAMRPASAERHDRLSSALVQAPTLIAADTGPVSLACLRTDVLPFPCAYELQVSLE